MCGGKFLSVLSHQCVPLLLFFLPFDFELAGLL